MDVCYYQEYMLFNFFLYFGQNDSELISEETLK